MSSSETIPLSEQWVQIGVTFVPIPPDFIAKRHEVNEDLQRLLDASMSPKEIDARAADYFRDRRHGIRPSSNA